MKLDGIVKSRQMLFSVIPSRIEVRDDVQTKFFLNISKTGAKQKGSDGTKQRGNLQCQIY
ncbi:MAG: hypothetical protein B1H13_04750 [Desulfobacteraceae bacterium 4484_190.3]|nr:MAG: hypothetical protein B1H13_04750 [Desulfobacteraceae bacterium 4484_190.3]